MRNVTAPPFDSFVPVLPARDDRPVPPTAQLDVVMEMLSNLDNLTVSGRQQTMARIVGILRDRVGPPPSRGRLKWHPLLSLIAQLQWESEHRWPDVVSFRRLAESVILLLTSSE
jgi:hypothetical protein